MMSPVEAFFVFSAESESKAVLTVIVIARRFL
jgi:hypothetical protein